MTKASSTEKTSANSPMAVIDIGASALRLLIAQTSRAGATNPLETLQQTVSLGKDVFTSGTISLESTEACVKVLQTFRKALLEYGITDDEQVRAVATSAVREARNQEMFRDRIAIATGFHVEVLDEAEVNRYTFMSVYPLLQKHTLLKRADTIIAEVGGGSTELLMVSKGNVAYSQTIRLGALRLLGMLDKTYSSGAALYRLMDKQIQQDFQQLRHDLTIAPGMQLLLLGGEARFFATKIVPDWNPHRKCLQLDVQALERLCDAFMQLSVDEIARAYHLTFAEAESLPISLLIYTRLATLLGVRKIHISGATLRDGIMSEMTARSSRVEEFSRLIFHSALELGRKYQVDQQHAEQTADVCSHLFKFMQRDLKLSPHYEVLLRVAGLLHETGRYVGERAHHKHSMYLIMNSEIFGLSARDRGIVALVARYHRRALPSSMQEEYATLRPQDRIIVAKLAAILRVADALLRTRPHRVDNIKLQADDDRLLITISKCSDLTLEQIALEEKGLLFESVFGRKIVLKTGKRLR